MDVYIALKFNKAIYRLVSALRNYTHGSVAANVTAILGQPCSVRLWKNNKNHPPTTQSNTHTDTQPIEGFLHKALSRILS